MAELEKRAGCNPEREVTPPMLVNEISRLFGAWMRENTGEMTGVMSQTSAKEMMRYLSGHEGVSQLELVKATRLKPPTVSLTLKKMEEEGLIVRKTNREDQRAVQVYLTEKGRGYDEFVRETLHRADLLLMQNFTEQEYETAKKVLMRMRENILKDLKNTKVCPEIPEGSDKRGK